MFLDIGLTILSLIPGIGDGAIFAEAIVRVVKTVGCASIFRPSVHVTYDYLS